MKMIDFTFESYETITILYQREEWRGEKEFNATVL